MCFSNVNHVLNTTSWLYACTKKGIFVSDM